MKLILAFLASFLALVSAIAIDADLDNIKRELDEITADGDVEIYSTTKDNDGLDKLVIFVDGVFEGTLVQTDEYNRKKCPFASSALLSFFLYE